jgi:hypothetical protein
MSVTAEFDSTVIEYHAAYLYRRARAFTRGMVGLGALVGGALGAYPLTRYSHWPIPHSYGLATLLFGALAGGLIGYVVGDSRANSLRVQAQLVLHQLQLERNTAAIVDTLARHAEQAPQQVPAMTPPQLVQVPPQVAPPAPVPVPVAGFEPLEIEAPPLSA